MQAFYIGLRSIMGWFGFALMILVAGIMTLVLSPFIQIRRFFPLIQACCRLMIRGAGMKIVVRGQEHLSPNQSYLYMGNHVNMFDHFILAGHVPGFFVGLEEASHFKIPVYGYLLKRVGVIPIERKNLESAKKSIAIAREKMQAGVSMGLMPEGTRTQTGQMGSFKKGGFHLAIEAEATIMPFTLKGAYRLNQKGNWRIRPGIVELIFHEAIDAGQYSKENMDELMKRVRDSIRTPLIGDSETS